MKLDLNFNGNTKLKDWWGQIKSNLGTVQDDFNDEVSARKSADTTLQTNIDSEVSTRKAADAALQAAIAENGSIGYYQYIKENSPTASAEVQEMSGDDYWVYVKTQTSDTGWNVIEDAPKGNGTSLSADSDAMAYCIDGDCYDFYDFSTGEETNFSAGDTVVFYCDSKKQKVYVLTETAATAYMVDTILQKKIDNEETARQSADTTLQTNIDKESAARQLADATLETTISNEESARKAADAALQTAIDELSNGGGGYTTQTELPVKNISEYDDASAGFYEFDFPTTDDNTRYKTTLLYLDETPTITTLNGGTGFIYNDSAVYEISGIAADELKQGMYLFANLISKPESLGADGYNNGEIELFAVGNAVDISDETAARKAADETLQANIDALSTAIGDIDSLLDDTNGDA